MGCHLNIHIISPSCIVVLWNSVFSLVCGGIATLSRSHFHLQRPFCTRNLSHLLCTDDLLMLANFTGRNASDGSDSLNKELDFTIIIFIKYVFKGKSLVTTKYFFVSIFFSCNIIYVLFPDPHAFFFLSVTIGFHI